jgi:Fe/S biogenesis protein NfuA
MVTFTQAARDKILAIMKAQNKADCGIRLRVGGRTNAGYRHELSFVEPGREDSADTIVQADGFQAHVDPVSLPLVRNTVVDFVEDAAGGGFVFENPNPVTCSDPENGKAVLDLVEKAINPALSGHGGFVELLDVKDGNVYVRMGGGCQGCGMVNVTLKQGIERMIKEKIPSVRAVIDTTDHAGGANPYYRPPHAHR